MQWENIKKLKDVKFKRLTGIKHTTFKLMVKAVKVYDQRKSKRKGNNRSRPFKLSVENQILMTLMYLREYRTQYHIGSAYEVSESSVCRTINRIENILSKCDELKLPGKQKLSGSNHHFEVVVIDATESPIERPKKNSKAIIQAKRKSTH